MLGRRLGRRLRRGDLVFLSGPLGSGKTTFVRGLAAGLRCGGNSAVRSPTFKILNTYKGERFPLFHLDLYRVERFAPLLPMVEECLEKGAVAVEWPERIGSRLKPAWLVRLRFHPRGSSARRIHVCRRLSPPPAARRRSPPAAARLCEKL